MFNLTGSHTWQQIAILFACIILVLGYLDISNKLKKIEQLEHVITETLASTNHNINNLDERLARIERRPRQQNRIEHRITYKNEFIQHTKLDVFCLAKNMYHEAKGEGEIGMMAVAQVTLNRLKTGVWGNTVCDVVMSPYQFSWTLKKDIKWKHPKGEHWENAKVMAENVLKNGARLKTLSNALYFHATYVNPRWASQKYIVSRIGNHIFYHSAL
jgi:N-acetylmuramoyl-L-alanine amidase